MRQAVAIIAIILFSISGSVYSDERDQKIQYLEQQIDQMKSTLNNLQSEVADLKEAKASAPVPESAEPRNADVKEDAFLNLGVPFDEDGKYAYSPMYRWSEMDVLIAERKGMRLFMGLDTVGRYQILNHEDVYITPAPTDANPTPGPVKQKDIEPGFQTPWGNMSFLADYDGKIAAYFDLYLASGPHPSQVYGHEGYIVIRELPGDFAGAKYLDPIFDVINVRAGAFDIDFGDQQYRRSNNASVQRNPLIGNYVVDPSSEEIGVEIFSEPGKFFWLAGFTGGTTTGDFKDGRGLGAVHAKLGLNVIEGLRPSISVYHVDHSGNPTKPSGTASSFFAGNRSGSSYGGALDGGAAVGDALLGKGQDVTALQGDITWQWKKLEVYGHFGWFEDADTNGSAAGNITERWNYYAGETVFHITERVFIAGRFSGASAVKLNDLSSDGTISRVQVGGGFWIMDDLLLKLEYVNQWYNDFKIEEGPVSGVEPSFDPSFDGVITEVSYSF
jgi:hypothetical protein